MFIKLSRLFVIAAFLATPLRADLDRIQPYWETVPAPAPVASIDPQFTRSFGPNEYAYAHCPIVNERCYFMAENGDAVSAQIFEEIRAYDEEGLAGVRVNGKWGYLNKAGEWVLEPEFSAVARRPYQERYPVRSGDVWGVVDTQGNLVFEPQSVRSPEFFNGVAAIEVNGKIGFIDRSGAVVIAAQYEPGALAYTTAQAYRFNEYGYSAAAVASDENMNRRTWGLIDRFGNWAIEPNYLIIGDMLANGTVEASIGTMLQGSWGTIDLDENWVVPPDYKSIQSYLDNEDGRYFGGTPYLKLRNFDDEYTVVDIDGRRILSTVFKKLSHPDDQGYAAASNGGRRGYVDTNGDWIFSRVQDWSFFGFSENNLTVAYDNASGRHGFVDRAGQWVLDPAYAFVTGFNDFGLARVEEKDKDNHEYRGFINTSGEFVIPMRRQYKNINTGFYDQHGFLVLGDQWDKKGLVDSKGEWVLPQIFTYVEVVENLFFVHMADFKYEGFLTMEGEPVGAFADVFDQALAESDAMIAMNAACGKDDASACMSLYRTLLQMIPHGDASTTRAERALSALERACHSDAGKTDPEICLLYGQHLYVADILRVPDNRQDDQQYDALTKFNRACRAGSAEACLYSADGIMRGHGKLADIDSDRAGRILIRLYQSACDLDHARGCRELGKFHEGDDYPQSDPAASAAAFTRACALAPDVHC